MYAYSQAASASAFRPSLQRKRQRFWYVLQSLGWHYLSNATCLIRPHLFHALSVVSRITIVCQTIRHF